MNQTIFIQLQEALSKASAARADNVKNAYLDLASFYQRKLDDQARFGGSQPAKQYYLV